MIMSYFRPIIMSEFWESKSLLEMTESEWESICDGCAKCCLIQLEDESTNQLVFTDIACDLLDTDSCRCSDYANRSERVPSCMAMNKDNVEQCAEFTPPSCSYRLLLEGKSLPDWHHLKTGDSLSVHESSASVKGRVRLEKTVDTSNLENHVVTWPYNDTSSDGAS